MARLLSWRGLGFHPSRLLGFSTLLLPVPVVQRPVREGEPVTTAVTLERAGQSSELVSFRVTHWSAEQGGFHHTTKYNEIQRRIRRPQETGGSPAFP